jgi:hypothetical protein
LDQAISSQAAINQPAMTERFPLSIEM